MPEYCYQSPNGQVKFVVQRMNEPHTYEENGVKWLRVFSIPNANIDTKWNPDSPADFVNKSQRKKGSMGDLYDKSKELSEQREQKYGVDKYKLQYYDNWSKKRRGKRHIKDPRHATPTVEI